MALFSEDVEDIRPDLQATAWGLFGLAIRVMILFLLILAPTITTVTGSWERWLVIALICNAALIPAVFLVGGAWRRTPAPTAPKPVAAAHT